MGVLSLLTCATLGCMLLCGFSLVQAQELVEERFCALSYLNILPCRLRNSNERPKENQYAAYRTEINDGAASGGIRCRTRNPKNNPRNQIIGDIENLGQNDLRILASPGFNETDYPNQLLMFFQVKCPEDREAFLRTTELDLQGECGNVPVDYIVIDYGGGLGTREITNTTANRNEFPLSSAEFEVTFRTSQRNRARGFRAYVICYRRDERNQPGCTAFGNDTSSNGDSDGETKRDLEAFHEQWRVRAKRATPRTRYHEITVRYGDNVTYRDSLLTITRVEGVVVTETLRFRRVRVLSTFDVNGTITSYIKDASIMDEEGKRSFIVFAGPGPMVIIGHYAYFQLFALDPRGIIPNPEEEAILEVMTESLLGSVNASQDVMYFMNETELPTQNIPDELADLYNRVGRKKRQDATDEITTSREAIKQALRTQNACNPVLRSSSRLILAVAENEYADAGRSDVYEQLVDELTLELQNEMEGSAGPTVGSPPPNNRKRRLLQPLD